MMDARDFARASPGSQQRSGLANALPPKPAGWPAFVKISTMLLAVHVDEDRVGRERVRHGDLHGLRTGLVLEHARYVDGAGTAAGLVRNGAGVHAVLDRLDV